MKKLLVVVSILLLVGCSSKATYKTISTKETFNQIEKIDYKKSEKIIVYCASGNRSKQAAQKLIDMGYTNVYDMGGISNWKYDIVR